MFSQAGAKFETEEFAIHCLLLFGKPNCTWLFLTSYQCGPTYLDGSEVPCSGVTVIIPLLVSYLGPVQGAEEWACIISLLGCLVVWAGANGIRIAE